MAARGIQLRRYEIKDANHYSIHGFRLRVDVAAVNGDVPREIFMYRRSPVDPNTGVATDEFQSVASFVDLSVYPANNPSTTTGLPFFRKDSIEVDVDAISHYEKTWQLIVGEVQSLLNAMNIADNLVVAEEVWLGAAPESASSASSASSISSTLSASSPSSASLASSASSASV